MSQEHTPISRFCYDEGKARQKRELDPDHKSEALAYVRRMKEECDQRIDAMELTLKQSREVHAELLAKSREEARTLRASRDHQAAIEMRSARDAINRIISAAGRKTAEDPIGGLSHIGPSAASELLRIVDIFDSCLNC